MKINLHFKIKVIPSICKKVWSIYINRKNTNVILVFQSLSWQLLSIFLLRSVGFFVETLIIYLGSLGKLM